MKTKYAQFIHEFIDDQGNTRYAVARWDAENSQYIAPLDVRQQKMTGCFAEYAKTPKGLGGYLSRREALRRARYLFGK